MSCLAVGALLALAGCGGGGGSTTPTTSTTGGGSPASTEQATAAAAAYDRALRAYARELRDTVKQRRALTRLAGEPPQLEALSSDEPAYAQARATAEQVDATAAELASIAGSESKADSRLYHRLYGLAGDQWSRDFKRNRANYDRLVPWVYGPKSDRRDADQVVHRSWTGYMRREIRDWERYVRKLEKVPARGELYRSFVDYAVMELELGNQFKREFVDHLRERPVALTQLGFYTSQAAQFSVYPIAVPVMWRKDERLMRGFVRSIGRLARGGDAAVGDAYRSVILGAFLSPLKKVSHRESILTQQLWMLYRVRQLEDTPEEAYEAARETVMLQGYDDVRNGYGRLLELFEASDGNMTATSYRKVPRKLTTFLAFAEEQLERRPMPPVLEPTARGLMRGLDDLPKKRFRQLFKTSNVYVRVSNRIAKVMRRGARRVDDPRQLKAAIRKALAATRPATER